MANKIKKAWGRFMQENFNFFRRGAINIHKERSYEHISIQKDFEKIEKERKYQRLTLLEYRKKLRQKLLTQKLDLLKEGKGSLEQLGEQDLLREAQEAARIKDMSKYGSLEEYKAAVEKELGNRRIEDISKRQLPDKTIDQLEKELQAIALDIQELNETKKQITDIEQKIEDLEPNYILITGMKKKMVLNAIAYYEFQQRNLEGVLIHPEAKKSIETVHYHVEHNLPVRRELLYEVVPEFFEVEIGELDQYEKERILAKRPRLESDPRSIVRVFEDVPEERKLDEFEEFKKQEMDFMEFVYSKALDFVNKYDDFIEEKLESQFPSLALMLENLETKPADKLDDLEAEMLKELSEIRKINEDYAELIRLNKIRIFKKQRELQMPEFVKNHERLRQTWTEKWEHLVANSFEFRESILVPFNAETYESQLDKVLKDQRAMDINDLISQSQQQYKAVVGGDEPIKSIDRNKKNPELVKKVNILAGAMNQIVDKNTKVKQKALSHFQSGRMQERSEESRILQDELTKVLYLNNINPEKYTLTFWAEHFNIEPQKLRNIFNFISYAVPSEDEQRETGRIFRFIYEKETKKESKNIEQQAQ